MTPFSVRCNKIKYYKPASGIIRSTQNNHEKLPQKTEIKEISSNVTVLAHDIKITLLVSTQDED